ncbi:MAG: replicative DNA helicase [Acidimicrobiales bacterium]
MAMPDEAPVRRTSSRTPPHNLEVEESLLGAMLLSREAIADAVESVHVGDFYKPSHGHIFEAITGLYSAGEPVDVVTVAAELQRVELLDAVGGSSKLLSMQAATPAVSNASRYARIIEELALLRRLIGVAGEIAELGYEIPEDVTKVVDLAESLVFDVAQRRVTDTLAPIRDLLSEHLDRLELLYERGDAITGLPSGYHDLDDLLSGLQPSALYVVGARPAMGKALALDTDIPTPQGWTTMGALDVGDRVFDESGVPTTVTYCSPVFTDHDCYEVRFDDDSVLVADAEHQWEVEDPSGQRVVITTSQLVDAGAGDGAGRWVVPVAQPLQGPELELPVDPYVLGCWLSTGLPRDVAGDLHHPDLEFFSGQFELAGYRSGGRRLSTELGQLGLLGGAPRQIPVRYLRGSQKQRLALLQGIMDTDGVVVSEHGVVEMHIDEQTLAGQVHELLCSLGHCPGPVTAAQVSDRGAVLSAHRIRWTPPDPVFRLPRKADRLAQAPSPERARVGVRAIVSIEAVPTVATRCITVDAPSSLYLAGRSMIPTHNTAFALGMATHAALDTHRPVMYFSLEMSQIELTQRVVCAEARVDSSRVRNGRLVEADWNKIAHATGRLAEAPIWIDDNPNVTVMEIRSKARRLKSRVGDLGMIVVDYLQLMTGRSSAENRQVEVSEMSRQLKILARELETPVVALSQLSRGLEMRQDKRPVLADLRESGSIEQDADVVMFIYRDEVYHADSADRGTAEIIVAKHRNGPTGITRLAFLDHYTRFANMAKGV